MKKLILLFSLIIFISCTDESKDALDSEIDEIERSLTTTIQIEGDSPKKYTISDRMDHYNVPGISIAVIKDRKLHWAKGYGIANTIENKNIEVTSNTLFQAGSISKPVAALSILKLVEEGKLDLDENINTYLQNWEVPESEYTKEQKVTLRRILSHTSGLTVHGFPGYATD